MERASAGLIDKATGLARPVASSRVVAKRSPLSGNQMVASDSWDGGKSSMTEHSFQGIHFLLKKRRKCNPCVRYEMSPMCQAAHNGLAQASEALSPSWCTFLVHNLPGMRPTRPSHDRIVEAAVEPGPRGLPVLPSCGCGCSVPTSSLKHVPR
jgi:hypothetical protein